MPSAITRPRRRRRPRARARRPAAAPHRHRDRPRQRLERGGAKLRRSRRPRPRRSAQAAQRSRCGAEQLPLELGELAVGRERSPRARAIAKNPSRVAHHGHSDERYRRKLGKLEPSLLCSRAAAARHRLSCSSSWSSPPAAAAAARRRRTSAGRARGAQPHRCGARADRAGQGPVEDLLARMRIAADEVRGARPTCVRRAPKELQDEREALADRLIALSDEIVDRGDARSFPTRAAARARSTSRSGTPSRPQLTKPAKQGVNVPPLERHKPELQRQ